MIIYNLEDKTLKRMQISTTQFAYWTIYLDRVVGYLLVSYNWDLHNSYISCFIEVLEKPASESSYPKQIPTFTCPSASPISALRNWKTQLSSDIPAVCFADPEYKSRRETV